MNSLVWLFGTLSVPPFEINCSQRYWGAYSKNKKRAKPPCMKYALGFAFLHFKAHQLLSKLGKVILRAEFNFARGLFKLTPLCRRRG